MSIHFPMYNKNQPHHGGGYQLLFRLVYSIITGDLNWLMCINAWKFVAVVTCSQTYIYISIFITNSFFILVYRWASLFLTGFSYLHTCLKGSWWYKILYYYLFIHVSHLVCFLYNNHITYYFSEIPSYFYQFKYSSQYVIILDFVLALTVWSYSKLILTFFTSQLPYAVMY